MPETPDIRQFNNDQFFIWAEDVINVWRIDQGPAGERDTIYDLFPIMDEAVDEAYRCYGLYAQEELLAVAGVSSSLVARDSTDRHLDILAALPGPDALMQKSALLNRAEEGAFNDRYSTLTALCTSNELPFFRERGYKVFENDDGLIQVYKTLTQGNITPIRFGER